MSLINAEATPASQNPQFTPSGSHNPGAIVPTPVAHAVRSIMHTMLIPNPSSRIRFGRLSAAEPWAWACVLRTASRGDLRLPRQLDN